MIMRRKDWTVAGATLAVAVTAAVGILCARGHVRSRNGPGAEVAHESTEKVTVRLLREPIATTAFAATTLDGRSISSADWRGKVVLVNFWATWCPPCIQEIPALQRLARDFAGHEDFSVLMVAVSDSNGKVRAFLGRGADMVLFDPNWEVANRYGTDKLPETYLVVKGQVVRKFVGMTDWDAASLRQEIQARLKGSHPSTAALRAPGT